MSTEIDNPNVLTTCRKSEEELIQIIVKEIHNNRANIENGLYPKAAKQIARQVDVFYGKELEEARHYGYRQGYKERGFRGFVATETQDDSGSEELPRSQDLVPGA